MANFAIYSDYTAYLQGRSAIISSTDFPYYATKATQAIRNNTFGNIDETAISAEVKNCTCEIAELYYLNDLLKASNSRGAITSEKVGGHSVSYADGNTTKAVFDNEVRQVIKDNLLSTGLLYRGGSAYDYQY
jgi:hypothetical protein